MRAILLSLRSNPGHVSHIVANEKMLLELGVDVRIFSHRCFRVQYASGKFIGWLGAVALLRKLSDRDVLIIWFPSFGALLYQCLTRVFTRATVVYVFHEPYQSFHAYLRAGFGVAKSVRIFLVSCVSGALCSLAQKIILPSQNAFSQVNGANLNPARYRKINLMFDDEAAGQASVGREMEISYIGTIAEDHAFDRFIALASAAIEAGRLPRFRFVIATRSEIPDRYAAAVERCVQSGRLQVQSGRPLSNDEINRFYSRGRVVWNAYIRSMQSGVLPKAYMFGTPVIVSELNRSEFFVNHQCGVEISAAYGLDEFCAAVEEIFERWDEYSMNCRDMFLRSFYYRALTDDFRSFIEGKKL